MRARIACKRHLCWQLIERNEVNTRGEELYEPRAANQFEFVILGPSSTLAPCGSGVSY